MSERIINHFCAFHKDLFVKITNENRLNFQNKVITKDYAVAMFAKSSIGLTKSRILNRYMIAFFG